MGTGRGGEGRGGGTVRGQKKEKGKPLQFRTVQTEPVSTRLFLFTGKAFSTYITLSRKHARTARCFSAHAWTCAVGPATRHVGRGAWRQRRKNKGGGKRDEDSARTHNGTEGGLAVGVMFVYVVRGGRSRRAESKGTWHFQA